MPFNEILDGTNYDLWHMKVQFSLNEGDMLDLLMTSMSALVEQKK